MSGARRSVTFEGPEQKARWLDAAASEDATDPKLRAWAAEKFLYFTHDERRELRTPRELVEAILRFVRDRIAYVRDFGGREEFADTMTILRRGYDDCDGKARTFVAIVRALGHPEIQARIRPVFHDRDFVHVQAEARFPGSADDRDAMQGGWLLVELIVEGVGLGQDPMRVGQRDAAGHFVMAGPKPPPRAVVSKGSPMKRPH